MQFAVGLWLFQALVQEPRAVLCAVLCCAVLLGWGAIGKGKVERVCIIHPVPSHDACQHQQSTSVLSSLLRPAATNLTYPPPPPPPSCSQPHPILYSPPTHPPPPGCIAAVDTPPHLARWLAGWLAACLLHLLRLRRGTRPSTAPRDHPYNPVSPTPAPLSFIPPPPLPLSAPASHLDRTHLHQHSRDNGIARNAHREPLPPSGALAWPCRRTTDRPARPGRHRTTMTILPSLRTPRRSRMASRTYP